LRHGAVEQNIDIDDGGWCKLDDILNNKEFNK